MTDNNSTDVVVTTADVVIYDPKSPALYGNSLLTTLITAAAWDEEISKQQEQSATVKGLIGFEMARAVMDVAEKSDGKINLYTVFDGNKAVEKLNTNVLSALGVIKRTIEGDEIVTSWTSPEVQALYDYTSVDKKENEPEFNRRFNNRKRLNFRLSEAYKAATTLQETGVLAENMSIQQDDNGITTGVIVGGPAQVKGEAETITIAQGSTKTPQTGATHTPTMASLVKLATEKHKAAAEESTTRSDAGNQRTGDAKLGMSDEDFGKMVNNLIMAINAQEGKLTEGMLKQLNNLKPVLDKAIAAGGIPAASQETQVQEKVKASKK